MKFKEHLIWTFLYLSIIAYFLEPMALILVGIITFIGTMPDIDSNIFRIYQQNKENELFVKAESR